MRNGELIKDAAAYRQTPWAVRPETATLIAALLRGEVSIEEAQERAGHQTALRSATVTGGVAIIPLRGLLTATPSLLSLIFGGGGGLQSFRSSLRDAVNDDAVGSILIDVNSPGGSTDLIAETAAEIRAARGTKPVTAIANTDAASGAYWLASQADELVVTPSGWVGSIGVFVMHTDWSQMDERMGVKTTFISAGKYKTEGNSFEPLTDEAAAAIQESVDEFYATFTADVAKGRGVSASKVRNGFGEGRILTAAKALQAGMVDRVATFEDTVTKLGRGRGARRAGGRADGQGRPTPSTADLPTEVEDDLVAQPATARENGDVEQVRSLTEALKQKKTELNQAQLEATEQITSTAAALTPEPDEPEADEAGEADSDEPDDLEPDEAEDETTDDAPQALSAEDRRRISAVLLSY